MKVFAAILMSSFFLNNAIADDDASASIQSVITSQLAALKNGDGPSAWVHAHATIKAQFGSPDRFMVMVQNGYLPLIEFTQMQFESLEMDEGVWAQRVRLQDETGQWFNLIYLIVESQPTIFQIMGVGIDQSLGI